MMFCFRDNSNIEASGPFHSAVARPPALKADTLSAAICSATSMALANGAMRATYFAAATHNSGTIVHSAISYGLRHDCSAKSIAVPSSGP